MKKTEKFWDRLAKDVDPKHDSFDPEQITAIKKVTSFMKKDDIVLDFGCARGAVSMGIAEKVKEIHGIDISSRMIGIATKRAEARNLKNIFFKHGYLTDEYYKPAMFNKILVYNVIHLLPDPNQIIHRLGKLLKPGGTIISQTPCLRDGFTVLSIFGPPVSGLLSGIGIFPKIHFFKSQELESVFISEKFTIKESQDIHEKMVHVRFLVAQKELKCGN